MPSELKSNLDGEFWRLSQSSTTRFWSVRCICSSAILRAQLNSPSYAEAVAHLPTCYGVAIRIKTTVASPTTAWCRRTRCWNNHSRNEEWVEDVRLYLGLFKSIWYFEESYYNLKLISTVSLFCLLPDLFFLHTLEPFYCNCRSCRHDKFSKRTHKCPLKNHKSTLNLLIFWLLQVILLRNDLKLLLQSESDCYE